jgi:hypothetical protein
MSQNFRNHIAFPKKHQTTEKLIGSCGLPLKKQPLLGIHGCSFFRIDRKEVTVKQTRILIKKISMLDVRALIITS